MIKKLLIAISVICLGLSLFLYTRPTKLTTVINKSVKIDKEVQKFSKNTKRTKENETPQNLNWDEINSEYNDVIAWIKIPGTSIDYPILQGSDNSYYLNHNYKNQKDILGSIFIDYRQEKNFNNFNTIIYGHNVLNESSDVKFTELNNYLKQDFFDKHKNVYIFTPERVIVGKVFASQTSDKSSGANNVTIKNKEEFNSYLSKIKQKSAIVGDVDYTKIEKTITLWTCTMQSTVNSKGNFVPATKARTFVSVSLK